MALHFKSASVKALIHQASYDSFPSSGRHKELPDTKVNDVLILSDRLAGLIRYIMTLCSWMHVIMAVQKAQLASVRTC